MKIKAAIKSAAKANKLKPENLSKIQFWSHVQGNQIEVSEWDVRKLGGFEAIKEQLFPVQMSKNDSNPLSFSEIGRLSGRAVSACCQRFAGLL